MRGAAAESRCRAPRGWGGTEQEVPHLSGAGRDGGPTEEVALGANPEGVKPTGGNRARRRASGREHCD